MVIPTYNEAENLQDIVARLLAVRDAVDVLVVDDDSPDGTGDVAGRLASEDRRVTVLHRTQKAGLGAAYLHGFDVALQRGYDVIGEMDADGSHQPEELPRLIQALADADMVIGSRWVAGGSVVNWPWRRRALSVAGNWYARTILGVDVRDITAGYRLFRRETLERIALHEVESAGYCFQADLAFRALKADMTIIEVPIRFVERVRGASKMNTAIAVESLILITKWGLRERYRRISFRFRRSLQA